MTKPAAFQACFTDWKLIRGRKCVQIVFEVPIEAADEAYHVLGGMPDPGASVWCAVARLREPGKDGDAVESPHIGQNTITQNESCTEKVEGRAAPASRLTKQAAICCRDSRFRAFLQEHNMLAGTPEEAATAVKLICHVESRKQFVTGTPEGDRWEQLYSRYVTWRDFPEVAA